MDILNLFLLKNIKKIIWEKLTKIYLLLWFFLANFVTDADSNLYKTKYYFVLERGSNTVTMPMIDTTSSKSFILKYVTKKCN